MISISGNIWEEIRFNLRQSKKISQDYNLSDIISLIITMNSFNPLGNFIIFSLITDCIVIIN